MRIVPFLVSVVATTALITVLNVQLPVGTGKTPRLGYFLSPQLGFWQNAEANNLSFNGDIALQGLQGKVEVYMDDALVPHVYADHDIDAYYVQGYLHAKFRLWQMEFQTHVAAGRLSEVIGAAGVPTDQFFRRLGMTYGAMATLKQMEQNPEMKAVIEAYASGVNAYIRQLTPARIPFEYKLLDYQPEDWTPLKTYLFLMYMSYDLTGSGVTDDLKRTNARDYFGMEDYLQLYTNQQDSLDPIIPKGTQFPKPSIVPQMPAGADTAYFKQADMGTAFLPPHTPDKNNGSNNWVVAGSKTKSGRPILANDPHLGLNLPSLWYEMQITTPSHSTYGASFPGSPTVIIGFNDSIAWGVTNAGRDVIDFYDIRFKDSTMEEYWFNGIWNKSDIRKEVIKIKGKPDRIEQLAYTAFGPVMYDRSYKNNNSNGKYLAVHWVAHEGGNAMQTFYELNRAHNYDDYMQAISHWRCPGQNFAFAAKSGDIAIKQQGAFVARWNRQGDFIMPGTDNNYMWQGTIPFEENPMMKNPERGFVSSANQKSTDTAYGYYLGAADNFPLYRGISINRRLSAMQNITVTDIQQLQTSNYNVFAEMARPAINKFLRIDQLNAAQQKYLRILQEWDFNSEIHSKGATVFACIWDSIKAEVWNDELKGAPLPVATPMESTLLEVMLRDSVFYFADNAATKNSVETLYDAVTNGFIKACKQLTVLEQKKELEWGVFKDTHINHLLRIPALSRLHLPIGGGKHIINATTSDHGPSWRMIVQLTDDIEAYGIYPGGQSGNPGSKYYDTFVNEWVQGKYRKLLFLSHVVAAKHTQMKWHMTFNKG